MVCLIIAEILLIINELFSIFIVIYLFGESSQSFLNFITPMLAVDKSSIVTYPFGLYIAVLSVLGLLDLAIVAPRIIKLFNNDFYEEHKKSMYLGVMVMGVVGIMFYLFGGFGSIYISTFNSVFVFMAFVIYLATVILIIAGSLQEAEITA